MGLRPQCLPETWDNSRSNDLIGRTDSILICLLSTAEAAENWEWDLSATLFHKAFLWSPESLGVLFSALVVFTKM